MSNGFIDTRYKDKFLVVVPVDEVDCIGAFDCPFFFKYLLTAKTQELGQQHLVISYDKFGEAEEYDLMNFDDHEIVLVTDDITEALETFTYLNEICRTLEDISYGKNAEATKYKHHMTQANRLKTNYYINEQKPYVEAIKIIKSRVKI